MFNPRKAGSAPATLALATLAALGLAATAHAQTAFTGTYTYVGGNGGSDGNGVAKPYGYNGANTPGVAFSAIGGNPKSSDIGGGNYFGSNNLLYQVGQPQRSLAGAIAQGAYITFTVTPAAGDALSLSSFSTDVFEQANNPGTYYLLSSATGFADGDALATLAFDAPADNTNAAFDANLSSNAALQNVSGPVEFRVYIGPGNGNDADYGLANATSVSGTVGAAAAPEPSAVAALGLGVLGLAGLAFKARRRVA